MNEICMIGAVILPILWGIGLSVFRAERNVKLLNVLTVLGMAVTAALCVVVACMGDCRVAVCNVTDSVAFVLSADRISAFFAVFGSVLFCIAGVFAGRYMNHSDHRGRFSSFLLVCLGMLLGADYAGNLITMYLFYEGVTLTSFPLVMQDGTPEAVTAGLKYLFYSVAGAFAALFGIAVVVSLCGGGDFAAGGLVEKAVFEQHTGLLSAAAMAMILGFGVKCGMFPLHGWLPTAHPVAPAPASALLSGVITKLGVLAILRTVYYVFGPALLRGTWVQTVWLILCVFTVFMGSLLAWREKLLKKRLAWSSVSQISYVLFGLAMMTPECLQGALLHVAAHGAVKNGLFLFAGAVIFCTGETRVDALRGLGKKMPGVYAAFAVFALALVGIPPLSPFASKWYLCLGALNSGVPVFSWLGPVVLLISALLTAAYLFPLFVSGFFPGKEPVTVAQKARPGAAMLVPLALLALGAFAVGLCPQWVTAVADSLVGLL